MSVEDPHPNWLRQQRQLKQAKMDRAHVEALTEHTRLKILALLAEGGFDLEIDRWGTERIVLQHRSERGYDHEVDFETGDST